MNCKLIFLCRTVESSNDEIEVPFENAVGGTEEIKVDNNLYYRIAEIFPDACPKFIKKLCLNQTYSPNTLDLLISSVLSGKFETKYVCAYLQTVIIINN